MQRSLIAFLVVATPSIAFADDPKFAFGKAEEAKPSDEKKAVEWTGTAEAGAIFTTGNSETTTLTAGGKVSRKAGNDRVSLEATGAYARSGIRTIDDQNGNGTIDSRDEITTVSTTSTEMLSGKARYDRFLTEHNSLFVALLASRDIPAGKELVLGGQLGYMRQLYKTEKSEVTGEIGYDFSREDLTAGDPLAIHSLRAFVGAKAMPSEGVEVDGSVEALSNLNSLDLPTGADGSAFMDTRINGHVGVTAKLGKRLAVQTSIDAKYDNRPGPMQVKDLADGFVPAATKLDMIMKASLIYTLF
jgi:hypothetical protein